MCVVQVLGEALQVGIYIIHGLWCKTVQDLYLLIALHLIDDRRKAKAYHWMLLVRWKAFLVGELLLEKNKMRLIKKKTKQ